MSGLQQLRERTGELADLECVQMLLGWDQLVMMPSEGAGARSQQIATIARLNHERARDEQLGEWLAELEGVELEGSSATSCGWRDATGSAPGGSPTSSRPSSPAPPPRASSSGRRRGPPTTSRCSPRRWSAT